MKAPGTKRLKLYNDEPLSNFAFKFNSRRYSAGEQTLVTCNVDGGYILQVTATSARLVDAADGQLKAQWAPADGAAISVAAANRTQVLLATTGGHLVSLAAGGGGGGGGGGEAMDTGRVLHVSTSQLNLSRF